jgi:peptide/nickel transport system permease protein
MKKSKSVLMIILSLLPAICAAVAVFFIMPDTVAAHFGINGTPDRYGSKYEAFILPAIALGWNSAGSVARPVRSTLLEILEEDYIDTARAKGRGQMGVLLVHAMRNAMLPVVTMMAIQVSGLLSGAVITETIFSINGIGRLAVQAIGSRDIPLLQGTVLLSATVVIIGNFLADSLYSVLDPRIRKEA